MVLRKGGACFSTWSQLCFCLDVPTPSTWSVFGSPLTHSRQLSQQAFIPCCHRSGMLKSRPLHCARIANCPGPLWTDCGRQQGSNTTVAHIWHACAQCLVPHSLSENTIEQIQRLLLHSDLPVHCWTECSDCNSFSYTSNDEYNHSSEGNALGNLSNNHSLVWG